MSKTEQRDLKTSKMQIRMTEFQKNRIKILANKFAGGCMTTWVLDRALNAPRKYLTPKK